MATKLGMKSGTHDSVTVPVGSVRKIRTTLGANQMAGFVTVPSLPKLYFIPKFELKVVSTWPW